MAYVKNYPAGWQDLPTETTPITAATLDNIETQYTEAVTDAATDAASKVATHAALTTGVHGVGAGTVAKTADIAVDANLSAAAQDAVTKRHAQNLDTALGTQTAAFSMGGFKITNLGTPTANADACTKLYADSLMASGGFIANMGLFWYGLAGDCPTGFHICNGADGTPDMRGLVVLVCGAGEEPGGTGGAATHTHDAHSALTHSGCAVASHGTLTHSGCAVDSHGTLSHSGCAVAQHGANVTGVENKDAISVTPVAGGAGVAAWSHTHTTPALTHTVTQANSHGTLNHSVAQANSHGTLNHSVTQADNHYISAHSAASHYMPYRKWHMIIKT